MELSGARIFGLAAVAAIMLAAPAASMSLKLVISKVLRDAGKSCPQSAIERMTLAGFPPTRVLGGTFLVTTEAAATTEFSPTVTPPTIVAPAAIHTFLSITMGFPIVKACRRDGSTGWPDVMMLTFGPIITSSASWCDHHSAFRYF